MGWGWRESWGQSYVLSRAAALVQKEREERRRTLSQGRTGEGRYGIRHVEKVFSNVQKFFLSYNK